MTLPTNKVKYLLVSAITICLINLWLRNRHDKDHTHNSSIMPAPKENYVQTREGNTSQAATLQENTCKNGHYLYRARQAQTLSVDLKIQSAFRKHSECLSRFHSAIAPHLNILQKSCQSKPIVATKMLRLTMDTVQEVIERMPAVYVIYYVRDPRATIVSRKYPPSTKHKVAAAASLCDLMRWDYKEYERINELYPGVIKLLRYEDYIADVNCTLEAIYAHIHERPHAAVYEAMAKYMGGVKKPEKSQSQNRADPLKHLTDWADSCKQEEIVGMNKACADILDTFNYTFMTHIQYN